jgi:cell division protease FtsH
MKNQLMKNIFIWLAIFLLLIISFQILQKGTLESTKKLTITEFLNEVDDKKISKVTIQGRNVEGVEMDGTAFSTYVADYPNLVDYLRNNGVDIDILPPDTKMNSLFSIFVSWFPMILLIGFSVFFMPRMQGGARGMGFGKSKAKLLSDKAGRITFKDVAGIDEAKEELFEIVDFLRDPNKFHKLGGTIPKGCLLIGPPGTGKTLLAKAIAGEANVPFFSISGSDFVEMFVGVGASRVRDMFDQGKRNAPCIIFIDEIDAVGRHRGIGLGGGNDEREQTLNQLLVEMDGFEANEGVIIVAATNRPDVLDPALLRPGRFDRQITVSNPDVRGREQIIRVHLKKVKHIDQIDAKVIARGTPGFSGAELANLVNEAALLAARKSKNLVDTDDLEEAKDKVLMGVERRSMVISEEQRKLTAYHEGGHAIVCLYRKGCDPIHKATIIPRGRALGLVMPLPEDDKSSVTRQQMKARIALAMGGRVAEELIFGKDYVTSGASQDIKDATNVATAMVTEWGLSETLGPINYGETPEDMYSRGHGRARSQHIQQIIDQEIKKLIEEGYQEANNILTEHLDHLHLLAKSLLEYETLSGQQIKNILLGKNLNDPEPAILISRLESGKDLKPEAE